MKPLRLLLGGSPCTNWSIAQSKNREVAPSGIGWELFQNYVIAKAKFQPDHFIYENNKSAAKAIKAQIHIELKGTQQEINSALVSAQNRQRFYEHSGGVIPSPVDRGILLKDILESGAIDKEKAYCLKHQTGNTRDYFKKRHTQIAVEPVRIGTVESGSSSEHDSKPFRVYSSEGKSVTLQGEAGGYGAKTGLYAAPAVLRYERNDYAKQIRKAYEAGEVAERRCNLREWHPRTDGKSNTLTTVQKDNLVIESVNGTTKPIYEVKDGLITIKGNQYPIKLPDGFYIIRKLTVKECCRLQTMPDDYFLRLDGSKIVSDTQAYKGLGNGWTAEVIIHLLEHMLSDVPRDYPLLVLSMYDGIGTGRYCLDKMGFSNIAYYAYEIDKYAMAVASANYSDIIQMGDAFQVRDPDWGTAEGLNINPEYEYSPPVYEEIEQMTIEDFLALATGEMI